MTRTNSRTAPPPPPHNPLPRPRRPHGTAAPPPYGSAAGGHYTYPSPSPTHPVGDPKQTDALPTMPPPPPPPPRPLCKHHSWSPDTDREDAWQRRRDLYRSRRRGAHHRLSRSVTEEDLEELRGCIELGFGFGSSASNSSSSSTTASPDEADRLSDTLPALNLYYAVHRSYSTGSLAEAAADGSPVSIYSPGESPRQVKMKLKQWAQVVACCVRQHLP